MITFGIRATVLDVATGSRICDAVVTITDGLGARETAVPGGGAADCVYNGAWGGKGRYRMLVEKTGYAAATTDVDVAPLASCPAGPGITQEVVVNLRRP
jgi:hypothetical protein